VREAKRSSRLPPTASGSSSTARRNNPIIEFHPENLRGLRACFVPPSRSDYAYLATKALGLNLFLRAAFAFSGAAAGGPSWLRAAACMSWYQLQDAFFTLFGRAYLNVLSKASGALKLAGLRIGDLVFTYLQTCASEVLARLMLGPAGDTPFVLSPAGLGLVFLNVGQGMLAGGCIIPAINQAREAGLLSEAAAAHLYQISGVTIHVGLLATFGHQRLHGWVTAALAILSWLLYAVSASLARTARRPPDFEPAGASSGQA
jgi:hypothetical protein